MLNEFLMGPDFADLAMIQDDDDIGIAGFIELIYDNGGNAEGLIKRLVEVADDLTDEEIDEIISMVMSSYAEIDSSDAEKLYDYIDWEEVKAADQLEEYLDFFKQFAPNLNVAP